MMIMLENGASYDAISKFVGIPIQSIQDLIKSIPWSKKYGESSNFEYAHLHSLMAYESSRSNLKNKVYKHLLYSFLLMVVSWFMVFFYTKLFYPILKDLVVDFDMDISILAIQKSLANTILLFGFLVILLLFVCLLIYKIFPELSLLYLQKNVPLFRIYNTYQFVLLYRNFNDYFTNHFESINGINMMFHRSMLGFIASYIDSHVREGNLVFQHHDTWMVDPYLSILNEGLDHLDIESNCDLYLCLTDARVEAKLKRLGYFFKVLSIFMVMLVIYIFYSSLMVPLNVMEVL